MVTHLVVNHLVVSRLGANVLVGANASILGNIHIGSRTKIGCGSVVLSALPSGCTAVGLPAKVIGRVREQDPSQENDCALHQVKMTRCDTFDFRSIWNELDEQEAGFVTPREFHSRLNSKSPQQTSPNFTPGISLL